MAVLKARSRLLSFRLTQDELENLRVACLMRGARNVSDFARRAVLAVAEAHPEAQLLDRVSALQLRLSGIETGVRQHGDMLRALLRKSVNSPDDNAVTGAASRGVYRGA